MTDVMKALTYIESLIAKADPELFECACKGGEASELLPVNIGELFVVSNALRAALTPPADDEVGAIRERHIRLGSQLGNRTTGLTAFEGEVAHQDRATLLAHVDRLSAELAAERARLELFISAACPVSTEINPRGYNWSEAYLDQARAATLTKDTP